MWMMSSPRDGLQWVPWITSLSIYYDSLVVGQSILHMLERQSSISQIVLPLRPANLMHSDQT